PGSLDRAEEVALELTAPGVERNVLHRAVLAVAGVAHQSVETPVSGEDLLDGAGRGSRLRHIESHRRDVGRGGQVLKRIEIASAREDAVPAARSFEHDAPSDARGGSRHEDRLRFGHRAMLPLRPGGLTSRPPVGAGSSTGWATPRRIWRRENPSRCAAGTTG